MQISPSPDQFQLSTGLGDLLLNETRDLSKGSPQKTENIARQDKIIFEKSACCPLIHFVPLVCYHEIRNNLYLLYLFSVEVLFFPDSESTPSRRDDAKLSILVFILCSVV